MRRRCILRNHTDRGGHTQRLKGCIGIRRNPLASRDAISVDGPVAVVTRIGLGVPASVASRQAIAAGKIALAGSLRHLTSKALEDLLKLPLPGQLLGCIVIRPLRIALRVTRTVAWLGITKSPLAMTCISTVLDFGHSMTTLLDAWELVALARLMTLS